MASAKESFGDRFYRGLLRILPFDFRSEFGDDMEETFREQRAATIQRHGSVGIFRMWWTTITRTCVEGSVVKRVARSIGPCARSKGRCAASRTNASGGCEVLITASSKHEGGSTVPYGAPASCA